MSDNTAILAGYTRQVFANCAQYELLLLIKPNTDLDSCFVAYDCDECEFVKVNGWMFAFEDVASDGSKETARHCTASLGEACMIIGNSTNKLREIA